MNHSLAALTLALLSLPGVGRRTVHRLLTENRARPSMPLEDVFQSLLPLVRSQSKPSLEELKAAVVVGCQQEEHAIELGGTVLDFDDLSGSRISDLKDPPVVLFAKGKVSLLFKEPAILIIGTRKPTTYSVKCAARFAQRVVECGLSTSSGLAIGCDSIVHEETLRAGGSTIAILPSGINNVVPRSNAGLASKIVEDGLLISEYTCDQGATRYSYVERDRLQAGISNALILVQSASNGGSLHACREMIDLNRPVAALSKQEFEGSDLWGGNSWLLSQPGTYALSDADSLATFLTDVRSSES